MIKIPQYHIQVRRDAHTTTPTTVAEHEVPIIETIFGAENVHNADGKRVDEHGLGEPVGEVQLSDDEFARLSMKYGAGEEGPIVEQVYGKKATKGLDKAIAEITKAKTSKK